MTTWFLLIVCALAGGGSTVEAVPMASGDQRAQCLAMKALYDAAPSVPPVETRCVEARDMPFTPPIAVYCCPPAGACEVCP